MIGENLVLKDRVDELEAEVRVHVVESLRVKMEGREAKGWVGGREGREVEGGRGRSELLEWEGG